MDEPWRFERITLPSGLNMRIARAGQGPLVVMLHGFPECWYSWRHQLRALSSAFECVAPDMRGYGETDAPEGVANYRIEKLVEDIAGLIGTLGRQRAHVVGHDWGGAVAWATAIGRPEVVERLAVLNCPHPARFRAHIRSNPRQMLLVHALFSDSVSSRCAASNEWRRDGRAHDSWECGEQGGVQRRRSCAFP